MAHFLFEQIESFGIEILESTKRQLTVDEAKEFLVSHAGEVSDTIVVFLDMPN